LISYKLLTQEEFFLWLGKRLVYVTLRYRDLLEDVTGKEQMSWSVEHR